MVIDTSALIAIVLEEPDASIFASAITNSTVRLLSAASLVEASSVLLRRRTPESLALLDSLISRMRISIVGVDHAQALLAREAYRRFGRNRHKANLNFGDCFTYALAKQTGEPLLFKGNDFGQTDLSLA